MIVKIMASYLMLLLILLSGSILMGEGGTGVTFDIYENESDPTIDDSLEYQNEGILFVDPDPSFKLDLREVTFPGSMGINETQEFSYEIRNGGNCNGSFVLAPTEVPMGWNIELSAPWNESIHLLPGESIEGEGNITVSGDPLLAQGNKLYLVRIEFIPENDEFSTIKFERSVRVVVNHHLTVSHELTIEGPVTPGQVLFVPCQITNNGNVPETFVPEIKKPNMLDHDFNLTYVELERTDTAEFTLRLTIPFGTLNSNLDVEIGGSGNHVEVAKIHFIIGPIEKITSYYEGPLTASQGEDKEIRVQFTNNGNVPSALLLTPSCHDPDMMFDTSSLTIGVESSKFYTLRVPIPSICQEGMVIPIILEMMSDKGYEEMVQIKITISASNSFFLRLNETVSNARIDHTLYRSQLWVNNTGNTAELLAFTVEGSHPNLVRTPLPFMIGPWERRNFTVETMVPLSMNNRIDNYLICTGSSTFSTDLNLRIQRHYPALQSVIEYSQIDDHYQYSIVLRNDGDRYETFDLYLNLPFVSNYGTNDMRWEGTIDRSVMELMPMDEETISLIIHTPESRDHWGGSLSIDFTFTHGGTMNLDITKPPIAILEMEMTGASSTLQPTIEDKFTFTGTHSVWNIMEFKWLFSDGTTKDGVTVNHHFSSSGSKTVTLVVIDENGMTAQQSIDITIVNLAPIPTITTTPVSSEIQIGSSISFQGGNSVDRDGVIVEYEWMIDGIGNFQWQEIEHVFTELGEHEIELQVTDNAGVTENVTKMIHVTDETSGQGNNNDEMVQGETNIVPRIASLISVCIVLGGFIVLKNKKEFIEHAEQKIHNQLPSPVTSVVSREMLNIKCPACAVRLPSNFNYCNKCGISVVPIPSRGREDNDMLQDKRICTQCSHPVPDYYSYCNKCGNAQMVNSGSSIPPEVKGG